MQKIAFRGYYATKLKLLVGFTPKVLFFNYSESYPAFFLHTSRSTSSSKQDLLGCPAMMHTF